MSLCVRSHERKKSMLVTNLSLTLKVTGLTLHTADVFSSRVIHTEHASSQRSQGCAALHFGYDIPKKTVGQMVRNTCESTNHGYFKHQCPQTSAPLKKFMGN